MNTGKIIVIEGACDGVGKSTQTKLLKTRLEKEKEKIITHHFPSYGSEQALLVENYLRGEYDAKNPYFINSLYAIDRIITWNTYLKNEYESGNTILLDRYTTSSMIYQSTLIDDQDEKKKFIDYICDYEYNKLGLKEPDKVLFLYGEYNLLRELKNNRKQNQGIKDDIHERDNRLMEKVYKNAMFIADYLNWDMINCTNDGKVDTIENIHNKIYSLVRK